MLESRAGTQPIQKLLIAYNEKAGTQSISESLVDCIIHDNEKDPLLPDLHIDKVNVVTASVTELSEKLISAQAAVAAGGDGTTFRLLEFISGMKEDEKTPVIPTEFGRQNIAAKRLGLTIPEVKSTKQKLEQVISCIPNYEQYTFHAGINEFDNGLLDPYLWFTNISFLKNLGIIGLGLEGVDMYRYIYADARRELSAGMHGLRNFTKTGETVYVTNKNSGKKVKALEALVSIPPFNTIAYFNISGNKYQDSPYLVTLAPDKTDLPTATLAAMSTIDYAWKQLLHRSGSPAGAIVTERIIGKEGIIFQRDGEKNEGVSRKLYIDSEARVFDDFQRLYSNPTAGSEVTVFRNPKKR